MASVSFPLLLRFDCRPDLVGELFMLIGKDDPCRFMRTWGVGNCS